MPKVIEIKQNTQIKIEEYNGMDKFKKMMVQTFDDILGVAGSISQSSSNARIVLESDNCKQTKN